MANSADLIPPLAVINERLSENQRERAVLRQLQRIAFREASAYSPADLMPIRLSGERLKRQIDEQKGACS
jgi:hypothetical protein